MTDKTNPDVFEYSEPEPHPELETFIRGCVAAYGTVIDRIEITQNAINEMQGIYMADDLNSNKAKIDELHQMHVLLSHMKESFESAYFDMLDEAKVNLNKYLEEDF